MSTPANQFKIGAFVLAGVFIFVAALVAFGARSWFERKSYFETYVGGDVEGLSVGSPVKLRGVPIGKVSRIGFTSKEYGDEEHRYVYVEWEVGEERAMGFSGESVDQALAHEVQRGLRARVKGQGITGTSIVSIEYVDPANNPLPTFNWKPRHHYIPSAEGQFTAILSSIEKSLRNIEGLDMGLIGRRVDQVLVSMDKVISDVGKLNFEKLGGDAGSLITEVRQTNEKLQAFVSDLRGTVGGLQLETRVGSLATRAERLLEQLRGSVAQLDSKLAGLDTAPLNETLVNAREATANLSDAARQLKEYPAGFLFGAPPPPARSVKPSP
jgi:hypothetical protein